MMELTEIHTGPEYKLGVWNQNDTDYPFFNMGVNGYATSGGTFFDARASPVAPYIAATTEKETLDSCAGHSDSTAKTYHYHGVSYNKF